MKIIEDFQSKEDFEELKQLTSEPPKEKAWKGIAKIGSIATLILIGGAFVFNFISGGDSYHIMFHSNGGTPIRRIEFSKDYHLLEPEAPTRNGYFFIQWHDSPDLLSPYTFGQIIEEDLNLYAEWARDPEALFVGISVSDNLGSNSQIMWVFKGDTLFSSNLKNPKFQYSGCMSRIPNEWGGGYSENNYMNDKETCELGNEIFDDNIWIEGNTKLVFKGWFDLVSGEMVDYDFIVETNLLLYAIWDTE